MAKFKGVKLSLFLSTLSYGRGARIVNIPHEHVQPAKARAILDEFTKVANAIIDDAEKLDQCAEMEEQSR